ncbi:centrosomal protein 250 [Rhinolophus ferrumequinum]|uniref:Centrosomal protein 250 n=1 Tax=Rhinolophus ferrumequinum TaxID=59479 RepID=A0A7J7S7J7_RHIFE|nr:centrosomal protein 250 [Rhinolophus ferrumequinum]
METGGLGLNSMKPQSLQLMLEEQVLALQQQMAENQAASWRKLKSSQEAQQKQAALVRKLQAKVLQYRSWCQELEKQLEATGGPIPQRWESVEEPNLEQLLIQLEEEQQRCDSLAEVNTQLRLHMEKADVVNKALREDVEKLTVDWSRSRDELMRKESQWRMEQEFFKGYLKGEHGRLLSLWREVVTFRRHFLEMKSATDRDLTELKAEHVRLSGSLLTCCLRLTVGAQSRESDGPGKPDGSEPTQLLLLLAKTQELEKEAYERSQELIQLKSQGDLEKAELQDRVTELSALLTQSQKQNEDYEKMVKALRETVEILETNHAELMEQEASLTRNAQEEKLSFQQVIKDITQVLVLAEEGDHMAQGSGHESTLESTWDFSFQFNSQDPDTALTLVRSVLTRRHQAVQDLKQQLSGCQEAVSVLQQQHHQWEEEGEALRQRLETLTGERDTLAGQTVDLQGEVDSLSKERELLQKTREELQQQLEVLEQEAWRLRRTNMELQLQGDSAQGEKEEQQEELHLVVRERERLQNSPLQSCRVLSTA